MRSGGMRVEPSLSVFHHVHPAAFHSSPSSLTVGVFGKVIVKIESAIEAGSEGFAVEDHRANESSSVIPALLQHLCQRQMRGSERHRKIGDAVRTGQQARKDRG